MEPRSRANQETWPLGLLSWIAAIVGAGATILLAHSTSRSFYDFDLHYAAGYLQRHGTPYLDLTALQELAQRLHIIIPAEGVYGTPALVALVFVPLSALSLDNAHTVWTILCVAAIVIAAHKALADTPRWPLWLMLIVTSPALLQSENLGNPSTITFALIVYTYGALRLQQSHRAGVALGIAIALKAYPAFLLIALIAKRDWRAVKTSVITCVVIYLATIVILGPSDLYHGFKFMLEAGGKVHEWRDNSGLPWIILDISNSQGLAQVANKVLSVAAIAFILWRRHGSPQATFAMASLLMLLTQSISWRSYFAIAFVGLLVFRDVKPPRSLHITAVIAFFVAVGSHRWFFPDSHSWLTLNLTQIVATVILLVIVATVSTRKEELADAS